jgi:hypothetical protein
MKYSEIKNIKIKINDVVKTLDDVINEEAQKRDVTLTEDEKLVYGLLFLNTKTNWKK